MRTAFFFSCFGSSSPRGEARRDLTQKDASRTFGRSAIYVENMHVSCCGTVCSCFSPLRPKAILPLLGAPCRMHTTSRHFFHTVSTTRLNSDALNPAPRFRFFSLRCRAFFFFSCRGLKDPSLTRPGLVLYMPNPPSLRKQTMGNLKKPLGELCSDGDKLTVGERFWGANRSLEVIVRFSK